MLERFRRPRRPSSALLAGALSGLLGTGACDKTDQQPADMARSPADAAAAPDLAVPPPPADMAVAPTYNIVVSTTPVTFEEFSAACKARGGFVQTHAVCAGNNACKGLSYLHGTTTEHSCAGMNGCGPGMSCVDLPPDPGTSGKDVYEKGDCANVCHGYEDPSEFKLYVRPNTISLAAAEARFKTGPVERLWSITAFGARGLNDDGTAYATMPGYHKKYSRGEIERVTEHIRNIKVDVSYYEIPGSNPDGGN
jgi:hypothetical protein